MHTHRVRVVNVTCQKPAKIGERIAINKGALQIGGAPKAKGEFGLRGPSGKKE